MSSLAALADGYVERAPGQRFPFKDTFMLDGTTLRSSDVVSLLRSTVSEERAQRIREVVEHRTFDVLPIIEDVYDCGNMAAVLRSADALGCGGAFVVNPPGSGYKQSSRVSKSAEKWLDVQVYDSTKDAIDTAKGLGYQVVATHLSAEAVDISAIDWTVPTAIIMGNEKDGVTPEAVAMSDQVAFIPMDGFVESYNISVAASLCLYCARDNRIRQLGYHGNCTPEQQGILEGLMYLRQNNRAIQTVTALLNRPVPHWQKGKAWVKKRRADEAAAAAAQSGRAELTAGERPRPAVRQRLEEPTPADV